MNPLGGALAIALGLPTKAAFDALALLLATLLALLGLQGVHPFQHLLILFAILVGVLPSLGRGGLFALLPILPVGLEGIVELLS